MSSEIGNYPSEQLVALYELGRLYFEMGYFAPAERVFAGLVAVDAGFLPARIGLGAVKLERGLFQESIGHFRAVVQDATSSGVAGQNLGAQGGQQPDRSIQVNSAYRLVGKVGLVAAFLGTQDATRAKSLLAEVAKEIAEINIADYQQIDPEIRILADAFAIRLSD